MLPTFLIIGAARSGTTSLHRYLGQHPDVFMSPVKEPRFFAMEGAASSPPSGSEERVWSGTVTSREAYESLFRGVAGETAVGESSVLYLWSERAARAIHAAIPDAKLIASLRHPADRAFSHFRHNRRIGHEPNETFAAALADDAVRHYTAYVEQGMYGYLLRRYCERFDRDRICVLLYDDLCADPTAATQALYRFLGVDDRFVPRTEEIFNASAEPSAGDERLDPALRRRLTERFREDILRLEELIDRDLQHWLR
jgi:hypothetical protein